MVENAEGVLLCIGPPDALARKSIQMMIIAIATLAELNNNKKRRRAQNMQTKQRQIPKMQHLIER